MRVLARLAVITIVAAVGIAERASGQVRLVPVGTFDAPTYLTAPPGDTSRVFVVERGGTIRVVRDGAVLPAPFLDLRPLPTDGERGLLSMAFAPDYAASGLFYVYFTAPGTGAITVQERRRDATDPDRADGSFARTLLAIPHDRQSNHNGGQLQFGPDGKLYAATGDGGSAGDPAGNGQNLTSRTPAVVNGVNHDPLLGKLLRLEPSGGPAAGNPFPAPAAEVWAYGLRNPWRFSFDRVTGDLIIADVGQGSYEEVDVAPAAAGGGRGANFGWNRFEGLHTFPAGTPAGPEAGITFPIIEHSHAAGWCSITGGYVVRDPALPELLGQYVYGDLCKRELHAASLGVSAPRSLGLTVPRLVSFGEDGCGRVYAVSIDGPVYRLASTGACAVAGLAPVAGARPGEPAADRRGPRLSLRAPPRQRVLRKRFVSLRVTSDEACRIRARGRIVLGRRGARAAVVAPQPQTATVRRALIAGRRVPLRLKIGPRTAARIRRALTRPRRAAAVRVTVTATDAAGNTARRTVRVSIRR
ncbi:MAG TPA: PQQ-dependent sugar dehydrogenase [Solirubrobacteraceae bacterium]|nr:PQQ-dependent sugar dehydrogenase [Solirubrobacteraceae bacterium]